MRVDINRLYANPSLLSNSSAYDPSHLAGNSSHGSAHGEPECPEPAAGFLFWIAVEILTVALGLPANLRVLWALLKSQVDASTSNVFTGSLAALDVVYLAMVPAHVANHLLLGDAGLQRSLLFFFGLNEIGSPLLLSCVCLDRYAAVLHPVAFMRYRHARYRAGCAAAVWALTLGYSAYVAGVDFRHNDCIFIALFMAAFVVLIFCNLSILRALRRSGPAGDEVHPVKRKAFRTVLAVFAVVLVSYLPAVAVYPYEHILPEEAFECYIYPVCYSFITLRACLQPLLFLFRAGKLPCQTGPGQVICCSSTSD
ncbi:somatostatin receptor type 5-like [Anguilla anguilla]|uniref:somatostatin receptor type 5-like n=1 Tax=Anguilla anguilla TaxID=7936 RepID=UPI0015ACB550|nr:somatostatin receptor type 5-like [Anguilla anguilla]